MPVLPTGCSVTVLTVHAQVMIVSAADRRSWTPLLQRPARQLWLKRERLVGEVSLAPLAAVACGCDRESCCTVTP